MVRFRFPTVAALACGVALFATQPHAADAFT
jgi:hypothetical protein